MIVNCVCNIFIDPWNWVLAWQDLMPLPVLVTLIEKHFFPKWRQVLCTWLNSNPNYDEVSKWYKGWQSMFPESLRQHPSIRGMYLYNSLIYLSSSDPQCTL